MTDSMSNLYAWMAGFLDGEGSISLRSEIRPNGQLIFRRRVCVVNTNEPVLQVFKDNFGGSLRARTYMKRYSFTARHKIVYEWSLHGTKADQFISAILPHLRLKKRHAELWLEFSETVDHKLTGNFGGGLRNWNPSVLDRRQALIVELRALNRRGVAI